MPTAGKPSESDLVRQCLDYLALRGIYAWRNNTTGVFDPVKKRFRKFTGLKGVADILGCLKGGTLIAVECKVGRNIPTIEQEAFLQRVRDLGGRATWVRSLKDLETFLREIDNG